MAAKAAEWQLLLLDCLQCIWWLQLLMVAWSTSSFWRRSWDPGWTRLGKLSCSHLLPAIRAASVAALLARSARLARAHLRVMAALRLGWQQLLQQLHAPAASLCSTWHPRSAVMLPEALWTTPNRCLACRCSHGGADYCALPLTDSQLAGTVSVILKQHGPQSCCGTRCVKGLLPYNGKECCEKCLFKHLVMRLS